MEGDVKTGLKDFGFERWKAFACRPRGWRPQHKIGDESL